MGVGRRWKKAQSVRNCAIFWVVLGIFLVQGTFGESIDNATSTTTTTTTSTTTTTTSTTTTPAPLTSAKPTTTSPDAFGSDDSDDDVEVVSLVKKDKRQAQRGYTDVPLDQSPFDSLVASSPAPVAFENDLPTFVDSLSDIADATPPDYNTNKFSGFIPAGGNNNNNNAGPTRFPPAENVSYRDTDEGFKKENISRDILNSTPNERRSDTGEIVAESVSISPGPSPAPSSHQSVVVASNNNNNNNNFGSASNVTRPANFFAHNPVSLSLNNGVSFGPVSSGGGLSGPGITPTGPLTDSLALPDNTAAAAINVERRQVELPGGVGLANEPPPFNGRAIPGEPGLDYPIYGSIPRTQFSCKDQQWPGYYADTQARCQVFWICQKHRMDAFLCPNGTLFNQQVFVCDWWFNVDCSAAPEFYSRNQFVYAGPGIGIDGQPVRGLSFPIAASNRVSNVLPPLPPPIRNNALLSPPTGPQGTQVQSSNQVARVAPPVTAIPPDFQSRADSLNNYLKSQQQSTTGGSSSSSSGQYPGQSGPSYQSQLVSRLQSNPNRFIDKPNNLKPTTPQPSYKERDQRIPQASSQITKSHITSGTSRPTVVSQYQPQHIETVSIVTTPHPSTRGTTPRPPPPPIPKINISPSPKPIKGPSPTPFGNVIKLGTTVTISTTHRPDYSTKQSLFKGIISSTVKPSKSNSLKFSGSNILQSAPQTKSVSLSQPPQQHQQKNYLHRPGTTEDPTNTVRPADYHPSRAPDVTPAPPFSGPGYLPSGRPHNSNYLDNFQGGKHQQYFGSSTSRPYHAPPPAHGMRSNQFSNTNGQRENIYAGTSRKDTFVEFPYSPSQQKNKQRLAELASRKDIKKVVTAIPHFYGQRSNVFGGSDSFSFINSNNKKILIDHTNYSQRNSPFKTHEQLRQQHNFQQHHSTTAQPQHIIIQHTTLKPTLASHHAQYLDSTGPSPTRPTPRVIPAPNQQQNFPGPSAHPSFAPPQQHPSFAPPQQHPSFAPPQQHSNFPSSSQHQGFVPAGQQQNSRSEQQQFQSSQNYVTSKPEQRLIVTFTPSPTPQQLLQQPSSPAPFHHQPTSPSPFHNQSPSLSPFHQQQQAQQVQQQLFPSPSPSFQTPIVQQRPHYTSDDAVTPRDGFTGFNPGTYVSIQTTAAPFSQQILKHNSLQPYHNQGPPSQQHQQQQQQQQQHQNSGQSYVTYSSTGPPPPPQQVIFTSPPTSNSNLGPFVSSTASPRTFNHGPPPQQQVAPSSQPHTVSSTQQPYFIENVTPLPKTQSSTPYSTPNNFLAAPTQATFRTTSPGHRQNPYLPHNHGKQRHKQHRPSQQQPQHPSQQPPHGGAINFPNGGITTTIKYPEGTGKLRLDFSGNAGNRKNIVDFTYSAVPTQATTSTSNYISTTPFPPSAERFHQAVSSTSVRPHQSYAPHPSSSGRGPGSRYAGAVTNKSNLSSSAIYVDTAATAESVSTPVTVPSPSATTPSSLSPLPPVSTSNYGLRLSANAKKRMTGAWQSYFSSKSDKGN